MNARRTRPDSRRDYRHFPPEYAELLRRFARERQASIGPLSEREALAARRDMYRFKTFLSAAVDQDADDDYALELHRIFTGIVLRVEPADDANGNRTHRLNFYINPIVAAMGGNQ